MKKLPLIAGLLLALSINAQNENKKWYFGFNAGLDFTSGNPVPLIGGSSNSPDNTATISDAAGNLLFYSDGMTVYNRLHNTMFNGSGLLGNSNGGQPATIVPHPGNPNLFYLFTCDYFAGPNGLRYSIIDMSQQSGLGAVTATKNILLYAPTTEKVIAVKHCNRRDFWVITHAWQSNQFKVYLVDNNGLNTTPVISNVGSVHTGGTNGTYNALGQIAVSKDGRRIGLALYSDGLVEFLDFDNASGSLSNPVTLSGYINPWGVEFSENGNIAYIARWQGSALWQVDLLAGNAAAIQASTFLVGTPSSPHPSYQSAYMKRGPDGKIYIAKYTSSFLGVINNPNVPGAGCNFVDNGLNLGGPTSSAGLDNGVFQNVIFPNILASGACQNQFSISDTTDVLSVNWNFGDPSSSSNTSTSFSPTHTFTSSGTYTVQAILNYVCISDTLTLTVNVTGFPIAQFSAIIPNCDSVATFNNASSNSASYFWDFGDSTASIALNPTHTYAGFGTYTVTLIATNACGTDTIQHVISTSQTQNVTIIGPTTVCLGQTVTLSATGASSFQWSGGSSATTSSITISPITTTTYYASPGTSACPGNPDTIVVNVVPTPILNVSGNTTICAGQNTTLTATGGTSYQWSGGSTDTTASITVSPVATTTYFVTTSNGVCSSPYDTITVVVTPSPTVNIVGPTMICPGTTVTLTAIGNATTYVWGGGASGTGTTVTDNPTSPTNYWVVGYNSLGCSDTDMVTVGIYDVLNAAILGDDTICVGESTNLSCAGNGTFVWGPSTGLNTTSGPYVVASPTSTITYSVTFTDVNGCTTTDAVTIQVDPCTGIADNEQAQGQITLQPNPAMTATTIFFSGTGATTISIYNSVGQLVIQQQATFYAGSGVQLDLSGLSDGLYTVQLVTEEVMLAKKLVIER